MTREVRCEVVVRYVPGRYWGCDKRWAPHATSAGHLGMPSASVNLQKTSWPSSSSTTRLRSMSTRESFVWCQNSTMRDLPTSFAISVYLRSWTAVAEANWRKAAWDHTLGRR